MSSTGGELIVALDFDSSERALALVHELGGVVSTFKVGSQLFTAEGPDVVRRIMDHGGRIFLDLKFHDIPNTVAAAGIQAVRLGVSMFNVHAQGGAEMMKRTIDAVRSEAERLGTEAPLVLGVTVLTSSNAATLHECGVAGDVESQVTRMAMLSHLSGLNGVVASPHEIRLIRASIDSSSFVIVTPGVRPSGVPHHDQRRVMTPHDAIRAGADFIVIGRAITNADNPVSAAKETIDEIDRAKPNKD